MVGTVPPNMWLSVGTIPRKDVVIVRNSANKKQLKRLLVGTVPIKSEEVIGRNSPNKKFEKVISRNSPTKKIEEVIDRNSPNKKIEEVIGKNSPTKNKFIGRNIATKK